MRELDHKLTMKLLPKELEQLEDCTTEDEWNSICDEVKGKRDGQYPSDWYQKVVMSGLASRKAGEFNVPPGIQIYTIK